MALRTQYTIAGNVFDQSWHMLKLAAADFNRLSFIPAMQEMIVRGDVPSNFSGLYGFDETLALMDTLAMGD